MSLAIHRGQARKRDYDTGGSTCSRSKCPIASRSKILPCGCVTAEPSVLETVWATNVTWAVVVVEPDVGELGVGPGLAVPVVYLAKDHSIFLEEV
jgi:hypothetical protein